ncbi:MAG: C40 family peptidase [Tissierellia bacterium]|nr:C40 family peptidase [Tissierellia bacterium]
MKNQTLKLALTTVSLAFVSVVGLRDTGIFVTDHTANLYSGNVANFSVEEEANIIGYKDNGYLVQRGQVKVTVPKHKILVTQGPSQNYSVVANTSLKAEGQVLRNLFLGERVQALSYQGDFVSVSTEDGLSGQVPLAALEAIEGPFTTWAKATGAATLDNGVAQLSIQPGQDLGVVSFEGGQFIILAGDGQRFAIDPSLLDFGPGGPQAQAPQVNSPAPSPQEEPQVNQLPDPNQDKVAYVIESAKQKMGSPYVWAGTGDPGYDCSGLVYAIYTEELGIPLPRTSSSQAEVGVKLTREELQAGDLVFFNTSGGGISHVGIYIGDDTIIHAASGAGYVKTDKLSSKYYTERFVSGARIL